MVAYAGRTMDAGSAERMLSTPRHPYTVALLACRFDGASPGESLPTVDGSMLDPTTETAGCPFASLYSHATNGRVSCGEHGAIAAPEPTSASTDGDAATGTAGATAPGDNASCGSRSRTISVDGGAVVDAEPCLSATLSADAG